MRTLLLIGLLFSLGTIVWAANTQVIADPLTTPIVTTATTFRITTLCISVVDEGVSVAVEYDDSLGGSVKQQNIMLTGSDYPTTDVVKLLTTIKVTLKTKGVTN